MSIMRKIRHVFFRTPQRDEPPRLRTRIVAHEAKATLESDDDAAVKPSAATPGAPIKTVAAPPRGSSVSSSGRSSPRRTDRSIAGLGRSATPAVLSRPAIHRRSVK